MSPYIVTYWWFDPDPVETGFAVIDAPESSGQPFGHVRRRGQPPYPEWRTVDPRQDTALDAFLDKMIAARTRYPTAADAVRGGADVSAAILSIVRRIDHRKGADLEVEGPFHVDSDEIVQDLIDVLSPDPRAAEKYVGPAGTRAYVVTGMMGGDDTRLRQIVHADEPLRAVNVVLTWVAQDRGWPEEDVAIWSVVEAAPDATRIYGPLAPPVPVMAKPSPSTGDAWLRGEFKLLRSIPVSPRGGAFDPKDVATINKHRARIGAEPIDMTAGWTTAEIREMAQRIRATGRSNNPAKLKRSLLR